MATSYNRRTGQLIRTSARRLAPVDRSPHRKPGPHLNRSINEGTAITSGTSVRTDVGSSLRHALVAHKGAAPHIIRPRDPQGRLTFYWERVGRRVSLPQVSHPGMGGTPYLTTPLKLIGEARGYRVIIPT